MKTIKSFPVVLMILMFQTVVFGQTKVFYQAPRPAENKVLVNSNPPYTEKINNAYIDLMEWYFEMRFTPQEKAEFTEFLMDDWQNSAQYRNNLIQTAKFMENVRSMPYLQAGNLRTNQRSSAGLDLMRQQVDRSAKPQELHNSIKYNARQGNQESIWLERVIEKNITPLVRTSDRSAQPFNRTYIDAFVDLLIFKCNAVAGKQVIEASEEMRDQMQEFFVEYWNRNPNKHAETFLWLFGNRVTWEMIKHNKYAYPAKPMTPYQLKREVKDWAEQVSHWFPHLKTYSAKRIKEYSDYVSRMTPQEMAMELNIQQNNMRIDQNAATSLRNQIVKTHVVNMNGIEGLGGGREWEYKTVPNVP